MIRFILIILMFLVSLLTIFPAPFQFAWLVAVAVSAYGCAFIIVTLVLLLWSYFSKKFRTISLILSAVAIILYASPDVRAYGVAKDLDKRIETAYGPKALAIQGFQQESPYRFSKIFTGNGTSKINPIIYKYASPRRCRS